MIDSQMPIKTIKLSLFLFMVWSQYTGATTYHVCDCGTGSDSQCVAGQDSNAGTSPNNPWQSHEHARTQFSALAAGDAILFCQGGAWDINSGNSRWLNSNCQQNTRCEIGGYVPSWGNGNLSRPKLTRLDGGNGIAFEDGGDANHEEGILLQGLHLVGTPGSNSFGVFMFNDVDHVTIHDMRIEGFGVGVHLAGSNPCDPNDLQCDGNSEFITLSQSEVINNHVQGWLGGSLGSRIVGNQFIGNGSSPVFDHNVYVAGSSADMVVQNNVLMDNALDGNGVCQGTSLVVHGIHDNLLIDGNQVEEGLNQAGPGCWGIAVDAAYDTAEGFTNITISNNTIKNMGNLSIGLSSCQNCVLENNLIWQQQATGNTGIAVPNRPLAAGDLSSSHITIRNNTAFWGSSSGGTAVAINDEGMQHQVVSNVFYYAGSDAGFNCLQTNLAVSDFMAVDHNLCHFPNAPSAEWSDGMGDLLAWQNATGFDLNSLAQDPQFANLNAGDLRAADEFSPMVDQGHPGLSSGHDITGSNRDQQPDMGAYELLRADVIFAHGFE